MEVEARGVLGRVVITSGEDFFKLFVGEFAGLFEAVDSLPYIPNGQQKWTSLGVILYPVRGYHQ